MELDERELDRLVCRQRLAEGLALIGMVDALVNAILRRAERTRRLTDTVFMDEMLGAGEPHIEVAEYRIFGDPDIGELYLGMVGRHVEGPQILANLYAFGVIGHYKTADSASIAILARMAGKAHAVGGNMAARCPHLVAVYQPARLAIAFLPLGPSVHPGRIGAMILFRQTEGP